MSSYATSTDYEDYTGKTPPADINLRLRRASRAVDGELMSSIYDATDEYVVAALRDATCEQADYMRAVGGSGGLPTGFRDVKIGSVSLGGGNGPDASGGGTRTPFSPDAFVILQTAGLTGQAPTTDARDGTGRIL